MGIASQRTGLEEVGLRFVESEITPMRGWALRPNPADVDDSFDPEELEGEIEESCLAADELVHVEDPSEELTFDADLYPEDTGEFEWEPLED